MEGAKIRVPEKVESGTQRWFQVIRINENDSVKRYKGSIEERRGGIRQIHRISSHP